MIKELIYLTYQTFPASTANSIQTIDNLKYLSQAGYKVKVLFPLRSKSSNDDIQILKEHYEFNEEIEFKGLSHKLPFGKFKVFEKYLFTISHYLWSKKATKNFDFEQNSKIQFFTRSDWVFYFLSKKKLKVIFECHQLSKTRKWVLKRAILNEGSKVIFLNKNLKLDSGVNKESFYKKLEIIPNGVDSKLFKKGVIKEPSQIIFTGNLKRFNLDRGLYFVINSFKSKSMPEECTLKIIGGPTEEVEKLRAYVSKCNLNNKIEIIDRIKRTTTIAHIQKAGIGLLINSRNNPHSIKYTSPLKYFEFLFAELNIVAIDFLSHRSLPFSEKISFFKENDTESFIDSIKKSLVSQPLSNSLIDEITLSSRISKIDRFIKK